MGGSDMGLIVGVRMRLSMGVCRYVVQGRGSTQELGTCGVLISAGAGDMGLLISIRPGCCRIGSSWGTWRCNMLKHSLQRREVENRLVFERSLLPRRFLGS